MANYLDLDNPEHRKILASLVRASANAVEATPSTKFIQGTVISVEQDPDQPLPVVTVHLDGDPENVAQQITNATGTTPSENDRVIVAVDPPHGGYVLGRIPPPGSGGGGGVPTITLAASDASDFSKAKSDFVCGGDYDDWMINDLLWIINEVGGGQLYLTEGNFYAHGGWTSPDGVLLNGYIEMPPNTTLAGVGPATVLQLSDDALQFGEGMIGMANGIYGCPDDPPT